MRSKQEIRGLVEGFTRSGLTRREYCAKHKIAVTTLDYWRRAQDSQANLVEVAIESQPQLGGFVLVLGNGRRIESSWKFGEAELARLIRVAEA
jgi:hypothetical protein